MVTTVAEMQARYADIRKRTYGEPKKVNISTNPPAKPAAPRPVVRKVAPPVERQPDEFDALRAQKESLRKEIADLKELRLFAGAQLLQETQALGEQIEKLRSQVDDLEKKTVTMRYISSKIARWTGFNDRDVRSQRRPRDLVLIRQACAYWIARRTDASYPMIGRHLGGRDHTTVIHSVNAYPEKRKKMGRNLRKLSRSEHA
ncbi:helix-turn-helix domain-containing protein [Rhizobium wenxiniae]|uniref:helix-turn-helix domain-containing protein n=1 Tax=Rhizobium wenxiniae TaxID=1737357 RepID=UPI003C18265E